MKKLPIILSSVVLTLGIGYSGYAAYDALEVANAEVKALEQQNKDLQEDVVIQKTLNAEHLKTIKTLEKEKGSLQEQTKSLTSKAEQYQAENASLQKEVDRLGQTIKTLKVALEKK